MTISVIIDSNAWNLLFSEGVDLSTALPSNEFSIFIPREVEIEIEAIPDIGKCGKDKRPLKLYIKNSIEANKITTTGVFGFAEANGSEGPAIYVGFGQGTYQSTLEREYYEQEETKASIKDKPKTNSGLTKNLADAAVAVSSFQAVVLTCDKKTGPISNAKNVNGKIIYLSKNILSSQSLAISIRASLSQSAD